MVASARFLRWFAATALCCAALGASAQSPVDWRARQMEAWRQSEQIMHKVEGRKDLLARLDIMQQAYSANHDNAFRVIFSQYLSWYQSFAGDYPAAAETFAIKQVALPDDHPAPSPADGYAPRNALDAIVELARGRQLVLLNEAHNVAQTRSLSVQLLAPLRAAGFDYLAVETLYATDTALATRGYPIEDSGFYTAEPVCAELVRTALRLGFHVVAYEATDNVSADAREAAQARNIQRQVFARDPHARLIVAAGYGHIQESGAYLGGHSMAWHLHQLSGIDGLAVEQTMLIPHPRASDNHPTYDALIAASAISVPTVFVNADGKPWVLRDGYDVSVVFPPLVLRRGRPTWLALDGLRVPYIVGAERCGMHIPCLVEARYAAEGDDAIPADRLVLTALPPNAVSSKTARGTDAGRTSGILYLRPGTYRLRFSDIDARTLFRQDIRVGSPAAAR